eukprot:jgi/Bigna1/87286/estExt_fgenesh1_pg.C_180169
MLWWFLCSIFWRGHYNCSRVLLARGADANVAETDSGLSCLHTAIISNHTDIVKLLIESRFTALAYAANAGDHMVETLLFWKNAPATTWLLLVDLLLDHGAEVNRDNQRGWTPIFAATFRKDEEMAKHLARRGANLEHKDIYNHTVADYWEQLHNISIYHLAGQSEPYHRRFDPTKHPKNIDGEDTATRARMIALQKGDAEDMLREEFSKTYKIESWGIMKTTRLPQFFRPSPCIWRREAKAFLKSLQHVIGRLESLLKMSFPNSSSPPCIAFRASEKVAVGTHSEGSKPAKRLVCLQMFPETSHAAAPEDSTVGPLLLLASWMPNRSKSVKQDNGSTESPVDFFVSRRDTRCGPQSEAKLVMGRHGRESTQRDHVIIGIRLMTRHQVTNPGPKTVSDVARSLAGEQKVHQGRVFVRIAQGAPALMLLQCEESGSVVTPPQGSTTSLEFEGHTTGIVPFIEALPPPLRWPLCGVGSEQIGTADEIKKYPPRDLVSEREHSETMQFLNVGCSAECAFWGWIKLFSKIRFPRGGEPAVPELMSVGNARCRVALAKLQGLVCSSGHSMGRKRMISGNSFFSTRSPEKVSRYGSRFTGLYPHIFDCRNFRVYQHKDMGLKVTLESILFGAYATRSDDVEFRRIAQRGGHFLDIGTGTGILSLILAQQLDSKFSTLGREIAPLSASRIHALDSDACAHQQASENFGHSSSSNEDGNSERSTEHEMALERWRDSLKLHLLDFKRANQDSFRVTCVMVQALAEGAGAAGGHYGFSNLFKMSVSPNAAPKRTILKFEKQSGSEAALGGYSLEADELSKEESPPHSHHATANCVENEITVLTNGDKGELRYSEAFRQLVAHLYVDEMLHSVYT